ncbi:MAG: hypothetical protein HY402_03265 [Elusimicrobia bacterium]|nr:hypothetical protein [Elusimicrobiota bacterium]
MGTSGLRGLDDVEVVLYLEVEVEELNRKKFLEFCKKAFPIYESSGGTKMMLYEDINKPGHFNEVGYYKSLKDYKRSEKAIQSDPAQSKLIQEWKSILKGPPKVSIYQKRTADL